MKKGFVYILSNYKNTVLYTGVTSDLLRRIYQHKNSKGGFFTKKYKCHKLVYFAETDSITVAIEYEKKIKKGSRGNKEKLIKEMNPEWEDLSDGWFEDF